ncbi:hypothetical protein HHI36_024263 [Cryptolaemus montrouzieri]|uniref:Uncharacterized protein n=1 Tax=Cryptolaemus montrouzieri TaxID=559131 RepID=A0ABD2P3E4_9CUCU
MQGIETPVPVKSSVNAGCSGPLSLDRHADPAESQAGSSCTATDMETTTANENLDINTPGKEHKRDIKTKSSRQLYQLFRCSSVSSDQRKKRKMGETYPEVRYAEAINKMENSTAFVIMEALEAITMYKGELEGKIEENPNTKIEIKKLAVAIKQQRRL